MQKLLLVLVASAFVVACGNSQQQQAEEAAKKMEQGAQQVQKAAEQMAKDAQGSSAQMAAGLQQMAQGFQQMAQGTAKPVDFEQLKGALPEVNGWTMSNARGEQVNMPVAISRAEARYTKDKSRVELEIVDTALSQLLLAPVSMFLGSGYSERSDDGFKRSAKIGGQPGFEEWNNDNKRGEVTAVVGNRFIVKGTGHQVENLETVRGVVEAVDLGKLAALK
jgi:X-X-X-Leu-X-X-Gly heptad repeat protein